MAPERSVMYALRSSVVSLFGLAVLERILTGALSVGGEGKEWAGNKAKGEGLTERARMRVCKRECERAEGWVFI